MNTLEDDRIIRIQKQRKKQLYKNMLDQQIRDKNDYYNNQPRGFSQAGYENSPKQKERLFQQKGSKRPKFSYDFINSNNQNNLDDDEAYLKNCERIISNLKEIKKKNYQSRFQPIKQLTPKATVLPSIIKREEESKYHPQYYPKSNYFTNPKYNQPAKQSQRQSPRKLKTIDYDSSQKNTQIFQRKNKFKSRNRSRKQKNPLIKKYDNYQQQSQQPSGINHKQNAPKSPKARSPKFARKFLSNSLQIEENKNIKQSHTNNNVQNQQLLLCLGSLRKQLQYANEQKQKQKQKRMNLVNQQIQVGDSDDKIEKKEGNQHAKKLKLLIYLRKLHEKSQKFDMRVEKILQQKRQERILPSKTQLRQQLETEMERQRQRSNSKEERQSRSSNKVRQNKTPEINFSASERQYSNTETMQLLQHFKDNLKGQQDKNNQLAYYLKETIQLVKYQQEQIEILKNSKQKLTKSPFSNQRSENMPMNKDSNVKDQRKLRQAVLKRLKKARMRGSLLNDKISDYQQRNANHTIQDPEKFNCQLQEQER